MLARSNQATRKDRESGTDRPRLWAFDDRDVTCHSLEGIPGNPMTALRANARCSPAVQADLVVEDEGRLSSGEASGFARAARHTRQRTGLLHGGMQYDLPHFGQVILTSSIIWGTMYI